MANLSVARVMNQDSYIELMIPFRLVRYQLVKDVLEVIGLGSDKMLVPYFLLQDFCFYSDS